MTWMSGRKLLVLGGAYVCLATYPRSLAAGAPGEHPYRYSVVDVPVSLAMGTVVRTPELSLPTSWYWIMIQIQKPLPFRQMECMTGTTERVLEPDYCSKEDPVLRADWTVYEDGHVVKKGSSTAGGGAKFTRANIFKFIGSFPALAGSKYVVDLKFTKDGTSLDVAGPHLIVIKQGSE